MLWGRSTQAVPFSHPNKTDMHGHPALHAQAMRKGQDAVEDYLEEDKAWEEHIKVCAEG